MARRRLTAATLEDTQNMRVAALAGEMASRLLGPGATERELALAGTALFTGLGTGRVVALQRLASKISGELEGVDARVAAENPDSQKQPNPADTQAYVTVKQVPPDHSMLAVAMNTTKTQSEPTENINDKSVPGETFGVEQGKAASARAAADSDDDDDDDSDEDDDKPTVKKPWEVDDDDSDDDDWDDDDSDDEDDSDDSDDDDDDDKKPAFLKAGMKDDDEDDEDEGVTASSDEWGAENDRDFTMEDWNDLQDAGAGGLSLDGREAGRKASKKQKGDKFRPSRSRLASGQYEDNEFDSVFETPELGDEFAF